MDGENNNCFNLCSSFHLLSPFVTFCHLLSPFVTFFFFINWLGGLGWCSRTGGHLHSQPNTFALIGHRPRFNSKKGKEGREKGGEGERGRAKWDTLGQSAGISGRRPAKIWVTSLMGCMFLKGVCLVYSSHMIIPNG
jgi:hypothetical protein